MTTPDPVLKRFRGELDKLYGPRIERVVLYGSRARGDARPDSDYDILLFLEGLDDCWAEVRRIVDIQLDIRAETDADIRTMVYPAGEWRDPASPLMHEVRKDGVDL